MVTALYAREISLFQRSLPYRQFKRDFTTVNDHYWGGRSSLTAVMGTMRHATPGSSYLQLVGLNRSPFLKPLGHSADRYKDKLKVAQRWHKLSTLVMMSSAFEQYLSSVTQLAIASDPALEAGFPKKLDGLALRKHGLTVGERSIVGIVRGDWPKRLAEYRKHFGAPPEALASNVRIFDRMRLARNSVAHDFGLASDAPDGGFDWAIGTRFSQLDTARTNVSDASIIKWLGLLDDAAIAVDETLMKSHVGGFELAALYLEWAKDSQRLYTKTKISPERRGSKAYEFTKFAGNLLDKPFNVSITNSMATYLNAL